MVDNSRISPESGENGEETIRPDFLQKKDNKASSVLNAAEQAASIAATAVTGKPVSKVSGGSAAKSIGTAMEKEKAGSLYTGGNSGNKPEAKGTVSGGLKAAAPFLIILLAVFGIVGLVIGLPVMMIGALDYNLQNVLGFAETVGILEKQGEYVTAELAMNGEMPSQYASALAANGVTVGQMTADGDFYKTNVYIADIAEKEGMVATASGFDYVSDEEGELALLFDGEVIRANDFVAKVESDPELFAAYSAAADLGAKYYYSEGVEKVYREMGLSRGNFNNWETTGNYEKDQESYLAILNRVLDSGSELAVGGAYDDTGQDGGRMEDSGGGDGGTYVTEVSGVEANTVTGDVSNQTRNYIYKWLPHTETIDGVEQIVWTPQYSNNATERAAELLNTAVSASEPYLASNAFIAIEEAVQRARVDGDGPVNHVMNTLTKGTEVSFQNVETGAIETTNLSILETRNFRAAVSDSNYDKTEAQNFSRDRVLKTTGEANSIKEKDVIRRTTVGSAGKQSSSSTVRNGKTGSKADAGAITKANENIELSQASNNSEVFQSVIGGNRIIEGGSFLSNTINMHEIGAMPSNSEAIAAYHKVTEEVLARKAEAERATLSPFDISSPNTFMGSIVHKLASTMLGNYTKDAAAITKMNLVGEAAGKIVANLMGSAVADGVDNEYTTMSGLGCETVQMAGGIEGDLYCTSHNTVSTEYMSNTKETWDGIIDKDKYNDFTLLAMDRYTSVGVKSAEVCEKYNSLHGGATSGIINFFKNMMGTYEVCAIKTDNEDNITDPAELEKLAVYTGAKYSFGSEGSEENKLMSGYALYDEVRSLLTGEESTTAKIRNEFYEKYPIDNSQAGVIARISGLSRSEVETALAYSDYVNMIASYDASSRYFFDDSITIAEKPALVAHSEKVSWELCAWHKKEADYGDPRNRNCVV